MGYDIVELQVSGRVSRHNSERDDQDNYAWNEFVREVEELAKTPKYAAVVSYVSGWTA